MFSCSASASGLSFDASEPFWGACSSSPRADLPLLLFLRLFSSEALPSAESFLCSAPCSFFAVRTSAESPIDAVAGFSAAFSAAVPVSTGADSSTICSCLLFLFRRFFVSSFFLGGRSDLVIALNVFRCIISGPFFSL